MTLSRRRLLQFAATAAAGPQFLCDSVVAEDCFRLLADRLEIRRILNERCDASIPERERSPECKQPRR